ncbi:MAG: hypothetical protein ABIE07_11765 [Candidatus Zixiibacteriota bacterium]
MRSNRVIMLCVISVFILLFTGCGGNSDDSAMVIAYFGALYDGNVDEILEMTDPYQRSPRVDFHLKQMVVGIGGSELDPDKWTYNVVARSDTTVRYRVTIQQGVDFFIELVNRDDNWFAATIPGPLYLSNWDYLNYYQKRPMFKNYPRYSETFGTGSSIDSSGNESRVTKAAREEIERMKNR